MVLLQQLPQAITGAGGKRVVGMFLDDGAVGLDGRADISVPLRLLTSLEKLSRRAAHLLFPGGFVVSFFARFKDNGRPDRPS